MLAKEEIAPGLYETYSNLGTFHILAGDFEEGLSYIDKALAINPNAHFGRERYQKWLVEYALTKRTDGKVPFPLAPGDGFREGFDVFLTEKLKHNELSPKELHAAIKGILGMMRFANHDNPLLLEALGDLLTSADNEHIDAKQLAARAYLQASYVIEDADAQKAYVTLADEALSMQVLEKPKRKRSHEQVALSEVKRQLAVEQASADKWYANLRAQETQWIRDGKDADAEFDRYTSKLQKDRRSSRGTIIGVAGAIVATAVALLLLRRRWRRPQPAKTGLLLARG